LASPIREQERTLTAERHAGFVAGPPTDPDREKTRAMPWSVGSSVLNSFFALWTFAGSVFVLFLSALDLPKGRIGVILSLFPFCGLLALGFAPVAARIGRKRVFLACYGSRKFVMALLLALPWVDVRYGHGAALLFLSGIVIVFAVLRALAETAYYPWSQEFVPNQVRGRYGACSAVAGLAASAVALFIAGHVLATMTGLQGYLLLIGAGSLLGFLGVGMMSRVPGGSPMRETAGGSQHVADLVRALRDRNLLAYLGGMAGVTIGSAMLMAFLPLYLKERLGLAPTTIVRLDIAAMLGGALASLALGWLADRVGSRPVLMPSASLLLVPALGWLLLPVSVSQPLPCCAALYFVNGVAANGVAIASGRLLFNGVVPPAESTAYTSIYYAWMGLTGGLAPLLAGGLLTLAADRSVLPVWFARDGYRALFVVAAVFLLAGALLYGRVRPDDRHTTRSAVRSFFDWIAQR